jgi:Bacterial SH3 domain
MHKFLALAAIVALVTSLIAATGHAECIVADPSPTPLNVRTAPAPYGRIIATLDNGQLVEIIDHAADDQLRPWVYVADPETGKPIGWVFREYIVCKGEAH